MNADIELVDLEFSEGSPALIPSLLIPLASFEGPTNDYGKRRGNTCSDPYPLFPCAVKSDMTCVKILRYEF